MAYFGKRLNDNEHLLDIHPPFHIDGNFGVVSGITEMLMQSHTGEKVISTETTVGQELKFTGENFVSDSVSFSYTEISGIGKDTLYNRRDNSDIIKVGNTYYVWYTRMDSPITPGYWGTIWYATSEDEGFTWKEQGMALGTGKEGAFDSHAVFTPNILAYEGKYYLYYTGVKPTPGNPNKEFKPIRPPISQPLALRWPTIRTDPL